MAPTVLQIPYPRWAATANTAEYEDNWRTIERWANTARCPTATPDWSQVSFRTPHPRWTDWRDAEENYLEMQRFASALAHLSTTHTCPSLQVPYKQWAKMGEDGWIVAEESENLLTIQRWANAMPQCCGCTLPDITSASIFGDTEIRVYGTDLTPTTALSYDQEGDALSWTEIDSTEVRGIWTGPLSTGWTVTLTTACGSSSYYISGG
jgi:hypothetical protein